MSSKKYVIGVALLMLGAATGLATNKILDGGSIGLLSGSFFGGSGVVSLLGLGMIIQSIIPEE